MLNSPPQSPPSPSIQPSSTRVPAVPATKLIATFPIPSDPFPTFRQMAWGPEGRLLAVSLSDGSVFVFDVISGQKVLKLHTADTALSLKKSKSDIERKNTEGVKNSLRSSEQLGSSKALAVEDEPQQGYSSLEPVSLMFIQRLESSLISDVPYNYQLTIIMSDGSLTDYLLYYTYQGRSKLGSSLNLFSTADLSQDNPQEESDPNIVFIHGSKGKPGFFVLFRAFVFTEYYSCILSGLWDHTSSLVFLSGIPTTALGRSDDTSSSPLITAWKVCTGPPYFISLTASIPTPVEMTELNSTKSVGKNNRWAKMNKLISRFNPIWALSEHMLNEIPMSLALSPNKQLIASLDANGTIKIWKCPPDVESKRSGEVWFLSPLQELTPHDLQTQLKHAFTDVEGDMTQCLPRQLGWWQDNAVIVLFSSGKVAVFPFELPSSANLSIFVLKRPHMIHSFLQDAYLADSNENTQQFFSIEWEKSFLKARIRHGKPMTFSRIDDHRREEIEEFQKQREDQFYWYNIWTTILFFLKTCLYYITSTFLWNFESPSSDNVPKLVIYEQYIRKLTVLSQTTPLDRLADLVQNEKFEEALSLAEKYNLGTDIIYQANWIQFVKSQTADTDSKQQTTLKNNIEAYLEKICDKQWILNTILEKQILNFAEGKILYEYGLSLKCIQEAQSTPNGDRLLQEMDKYMIRCRLFLLRYLDRLQTLQELDSHASTDDKESFPERFNEFRDTNIVFIAIEYAYREDFKALHVLFTRHGSELLSYRMHILEHILESVPPKSYATLLPTICDDDITKGFLIHNIHNLRLTCFQRVCGE
jgi:WD40 repeat protein